jgi:hypothetical protein
MTAHVHLIPRLHVWSFISTRPMWFVGTEATLPLLSTVLLTLFFQFLRLNCIQEWISLRELQTCHVMKVGE